MLNTTIINYLIDHPGYTKAEDLAQSCGMKVSELYQKIPELVELFWGYEIELLWQNDRGIAIRGREADVRKCGVEQCGRLDLIPQPVDLGYMPEDDTRVDQAVIRIAERVGADLDSNPPVAEQLREHLVKAVERTAKGMPVLNPYMAAAKESQPELFRAAEETLADLYPELTFTVDEVGYIVLYYTVLLKISI